MKKKHYLIIFLLVLNATLIYSQVISRCGTYVQQAQVNLEQTFTIPQASPAESLPQLNRTLTITVFVVKNSAGQAGVTTSQINSAIDLLNQTFHPIALSFKIDSIRYVGNYQLDSLTAGQNEHELETSYTEDNVINLYLVSHLYDQYQSAVCGFTYMPPSTRNDIFIQKGCLGGTSLEHQMGHFFDLYHTHETIFGQELVARPGNCALAGDRCCDTPADPNIEGFVDTYCIYNGTAKDANNQFYTPSTKNIMSSSNDDCRCYLSPTQFLRIEYALGHFRSNLR